MNLLLQPLGACPRHAENCKHRKRHIFKNRPFSLARQQKTLKFIVFLLSRQRKIPVFKKWQIPVFFHFSDCCGIDSQSWKECVIGNTRRITLWSFPPGQWTRWTSLLWTEGRLSRMPGTLLSPTDLRVPQGSPARGPLAGSPKWCWTNICSLLFCYFVQLLWTK